MSAKRKDNKGRILQTGESQRANGTYMYRYKSIKGERKSVYAKTLKELREKEKEINNDIYNELDINKNITLYKAVESLVELRKCKLKTSSTVIYEAQLNKFKSFDIANKPVANITTIEAKKWLTSLSKEFKYGYIEKFYKLAKASVEMLVDDAVIKRNPFNFNLSSIIKHDKDKKIALTTEQENNLLEFVKNHPHHSINKSYLWILLALETGMRLSELWGLTVDDIDLQNNLISINKQRCKYPNKPVYIDTPKSGAGVRQIPITNKLRPILIHMIENRGEECFINGKVYDFVINTIYDKIENPNTFSRRLEAIVKRYNETHDDKLPHITPHILRHTYCTKLVRAGVNLKAVQNVMGHHSVDISLDIYTHFNIEDIQTEMLKVG